LFIQQKKASSMNQKMQVPLHFSSSSHSVFANWYYN